MDFYSNHNLINDTNLTQMKVETKEHEVGT